MTQTFLWHDYETWGANPRLDRPVQFAAIRTTPELEVIGEPAAFACKPPHDRLPQPQACLITGLVPQDADRDGSIEAEFAAAVHDQLALPGTCAVGYNSIRFDDEVTRQLLYRNFFDPYAREWDNRCSRWDLIDLVRMCYALRPQGIEWPMREDATPSFRLEHLAAANHLEQSRAHDALSDVETTISLAKLLRARQPKLFGWHLALRRKQRVFELLDVANMTPLLHVSQRYPAERGCLAVVVPIAEHPQRKNEIIVADLDPDPAWARFSAEEIRERLFVARADLPEGEERVPLKTVHANKSPALAPLSVLQGVDAARIRLDLGRCLSHLAMLRTVENLAARVREAFAQETARETPDPELALYAGFASDADRRRCAQVRATPPEQLGSHDFGFSDPKYNELLFRYRAHNWPHSLSPEEHARWRAHCRQTLTKDMPLTTLTLQQYEAQIIALRAQMPVGEKQMLLDKLEAWGRYLQDELA
ncbi:MAG TPA: exodeoxyribonuclease I [Rhodanobacteraceae bacterium]|nr:exodeoxyribonuclease I [Rhodanobacteraceae bacterium]